MTITEFLLERIADDEAHAEGDELVLPFGPTRVLAECAAKRKIVEGVLTLERDPARWTNALLHLQYTQWMHWFVYPFAAVYRDHPDYWRGWGK